LGVASILFSAGRQIEIFRFLQETGKNKKENPVNPV
jgi:hypothetical protein